MLDAAFLIDVDAYAGRPRAQPKEEQADHYDSNANPHHPETRIGYADDDTGNADQKADDKQCDLPTFAGGYKGEHRFFIGAVSDAIATKQEATHLVFD